MEREFTTDDTDKSVVLADGTSIGTVSDVQDGQARVTLEDNPDLTEVVKTALGWDDAANTHDLQNEDVETITDEEVRLRNR